MDANAGDGFGVALAFVGQLGFQVGENVGNGIGVQVGGGVGVSRTVGTGV